MIEKLLERWFLIPLEPGAELVVAMLVVGGGMILSRSLPRGSAPDRLRIPPMIRLTAGAVVAVWVITTTVQALWITFPTILWWSFGLPLVIAAAGNLAVAFTIPRRTRRMGEPALVGIRRNWWSFADRVPLILTGTAGALTFVVTLICGAVSAPDEYGRYVFLKFGDGGVVTFYGWTFGVPALIGLLLLVAATLIALSRIATRPFSSSAAVRNETTSRRGVSNGLVYLTRSALTLTLGAILEMIGGAGSSSAGVGIPGVGDFAWSPGYSSFAQFFTWSGWAVQVASFVILIVLALGFIPRRSVASSEGAIATSEVSR